MGNKVQREEFLGRQRQELQVSRNVKLLCKHCVVFKADLSIAEVFVEKTLQGESRRG